MKKKIILIGYMASGKTYVGLKLAKILDYSFIDLDQYIEDKEETSISNIFKQKGELYFRKKERFYLNDLLKKNINLVLATGGGTPCYYNNMTLIKDESLNSIYLKVSIGTIVNRLKNETSKRPLVAHLKNDDELTTFIGKHLFERNQYYNEAKFIINANNDGNMVVEEIITKLF